MRVGSSYSLAEDPPDGHKTNQTRHNATMPRIVLILPTATYRAADFMEAADGLDLEITVASERPQLLGEAMGEGFLLIDCARPEESAATIVALGRKHPLDGRGRRRRRGCPDRGTGLRAARAPSQPCPCGRRHPQQGDAPSRPPRGGPPAPVPGGRAGGGHDRNSPNTSASRWSSSPCRCPGAGA